MNFDIRKNGQLFGPHTYEDLKALVASGEVSLTDMVIKEYGEELPVGEFLEKARPLKLKVLAPPVPEKLLTPAPAPPSVPPRAPMPTASTEPPLLAAAARQKRATVPLATAAAKGGIDEETRERRLFRINVAAAIVCACAHFYRFRSNGYDIGPTLGFTLAATVGPVLLSLALRALRPNLRTPHGRRVSVLLGLILSFLGALRGFLGV